MDLHKLTGGNETTRFTEFYFAHYASPYFTMLYASQSDESVWVTYVCVGHLRLCPNLTRSNSNWPAETDGRLDKEASGLPARLDWKCASSIAHFQRNCRTLAAELSIHGTDKSANDRTQRNRQARIKRPLTVPFVDLRTQYAALRDEIRAAIEGVLESQQFVLGPHGAALEK